MRSSTISKHQVIGGDCLVSADPAVILHTVLGPCVAVAICDPVAGIGGMNNFLLPSSSGREASNRYGDMAMAALVEEMTRMGGRRARMEARLYGGRAVRFMGGDVGAANVSMAASFLSRNSIRLVDFDHGGDDVRWVNFHPVSGQTHVKSSLRPDHVPEASLFARKNAVPYFS